LKGRLTLLAHFQLLNFNVRHTHLGVYVVLARRLVRVVHVDVRRLVKTALLKVVSAILSVPQWKVNGRLHEAILVCVRTRVHPRSNFVLLPFLICEVNVEVVQKIHFVALYKCVLQNLRYILTLYLHVGLQQPTNFSVVSAAAVPSYTQNSLVPVDFANDYSTLLASAHETTHSTGVLLTGSRLTLILMVELRIQMELRLV
jgi:hypothetical protein